MTAEARLVELDAALRSVGIEVLVMGGHAVRYYGVQRGTVDFDVHAALDPATWRDLAAAIHRAPQLATAREGPSWRPESFRRFVVGALEDGREERLEIWRANHLLAPWPELVSRAETGRYGGGALRFLGLDDLIRSKETEREDDWNDVRLLEEIADERALLRARDDASHVRALSRLRSRRGFERASAAGHLSSRTVVDDAMRAAAGPLSAAFLAPLAPLRPPPRSRRRSPSSSPARCVRSIQAALATWRWSKRCAVSISDNDKRRTAPTQRTGVGAAIFHEKMATMFARSFRGRGRRAPPLAVCACSRGARADARLAR